MIKTAETIGKCSKKDLLEYIFTNGEDAIAEKCREVTHHIHQLTEMMGEVIRDNGMACIVGGIEVHVTCYGAGEKLFEAILGRTVKSKKEEEEDSDESDGQED